MNENETRPTNFIRSIIEEDTESGKYGGSVHTRFPPEPNGYLHIGHAKAFCLNYSVAEEYGGLYNLRFDDTNPIREEVEYVDAIIEDIRWMGFDWEDRLYFASDYFEQLYEFAVDLIKKGKAYVDDLSAEQIREYRGTLTEPGKDSPFRNRTIEENLELFDRMRAGEFPDGERVLRAKIDMSSGNINLRDPVMYRILHVSHHRTGDEWCIYPTYDFAHGQSDSIEGITHSLCSLEFQNNRPLYNWYLDELGIYHPQQIEFARLNLTYTVMSKRKLIRLVKEGYVNGWDDPRLPTLSGMRRRGYTPEAIRTFLDNVGVAKSDSVVDVALLEYYIRQDLNKRSPRVMGVLRPLKVVIVNYPEDYAYFITCVDVIKNESGEVVELHCTYDPATYGGDAPDGRKVKATLHWVSAAHAVEAEIRLYDRLFINEYPEDVEDGQDFTSNINPDSLEVISDAYLEPSLIGAEPGSRYQFERIGYFAVDPDSTEDKLVFNRTVPLRDTWARIKKQQKK
jgi:glutaminyl-tRNA synthetase